MEHTCPLMLELYLRAENTHTHTQRGSFNKFMPGFHLLLFEMDPFCYWLWIHLEWQIWAFLSMMLFPWLPRHEYHSLQEGSKNPHPFFWNTNPVHSMKHCSVFNICLQYIHKQEKRGSLENKTQPYSTHISASLQLHMPCNRVRVII